MVIYKLSTGDEVHRYQKSIVIKFKDDRKVLSTSYLNGGYNEKLKAVYNYDANPRAGMECKLRANTLREHMILITEEIGLDPYTTTGLSTAASMDNVSIKTVSYEDLTVTAIVTAGVEVNGGRAGDPASFHEREGKAVMLKEGTINILLYIDADMPEGSMTRALVTCTEAKTAALQELMAGSNYSRGIATGSGTDGTIITCNSKSKLKLINAGKHSKLGELIGLAVKPAVKEALYLQTGLCPKNQFSMLRRMKRFGLDVDKIWNRYKTISSNPLDKPEFVNELEVLDKEEEIVILTSLYVHLMDQLDWQLISPHQAIEEGKNIIQRLKARYAIGQEFNFRWNSCDEAIEAMTENYGVLMAAIIEGGRHV
ncbi:adenosylcobinamide amidohydrolase [Lutispora thermophila]|uniref:Adenosylcobinamide amidohydrolase n=1 Tax=Lutispora thermophila DSM 19022 TaxID=1122184 RepID=A0A1M6H9H9_9FIRM|nr:adenosylcobinamide amidohydrolase [Lutispora thermophila]SHJ18763.1 Adenosylcobinamide amidohydrolase [Lutispora thermophila DSM 19022]